MNAHVHNYLGYALDCYIEARRAGKIADFNYCLDLALEVYCEIPIPVPPPIAKPEVKPPAPAPKLVPDFGSAFTHPKTK